MPTIYIEPVRATGTPSKSNAGQIAPTSLTDKIRDAFARFDTINVASEPRPAAGADYRLAGSLEYGETATTLRFQLIDTAENTIAWSHSFDYPAAAADQDAAEDAIVMGLTDALLQSYGVIRARDRAHQLAAPGGDPRYRCVLEAADSLRFPDPPLHERACLERLTALDPSFAVGFEYLALIYYREDALGLPPRPGDAPALDRALRAARHAIELAPASARAYQDLFVVLYARHDVAAAFAAADKAIALNKYDLITCAEYGGRLIMTGEVARGLDMLRHAAAHSGGVLPAWQHYYFFLGNYLAGDMKQAAVHAGQITTDDYPLGLVARAIVAKRCGHGDEAHRLIDRLHRGPAGLAHRCPPAPGKEHLRTTNRRPPAARSRRCRADRRELSRLFPKIRFRGSSVQPHSLFAVAAGPLSDKIHANDVIFKCLYVNGFNSKLPFPCAMLLCNQDKNWQSLTQGPSELGPLEPVNNV